MNPDASGRRPGSIGEYVGGGALDTAHVLMDEAADMLANGSKTTRSVLKRIPGLPGFIYNTHQVLSSDEPLRASAGLAGGLVGDVGGGALGAAAGGVNAPIGAVLASAAGQDVATDAYDDYYKDHRAQMDAANRWIVQRRKEILGR